MSWSIGWLIDAPLWQLLVAMAIATILLILILSSILKRANVWEEESHATQRSDNAKIVPVESDEKESHVFAVKNANGENTPNKSDRTSQGENGIRTDCSANQTYAASVVNQF